MGKTIISKSNMISKGSPSVGYVWTDADASLWYDELFTANAGDIDSNSLYGLSLDALKSGMDNLFIDLKVDSTWGEMDYQYWFIGGTSATHAINAKKLVSDLTFNGSPIHNATGMVLNGTTQFASGNNNPSLESDANSNHLLLFGNPSTNSFGIGSRNSASQGLYIRQNAVFREWVSLETGANGRVQVATTANKDKVHIGSRISAIRSDLYEDGVSIGNILTTGGTLTTFPTCIGVWDNAGTPLDFMTGNVKASTFGGGLTSSQATTATNAINTFNTLLGR